MEINNCPICNINQIKLSRFKQSGDCGNIFTIKKCKKCKVFFTNHFISNEELKLHYSNHYYSKDLSRLKGFFEDFIPLRWLQRKSNVERFKPAGKILDIGCGNGKFLLSLKKDKWEIHGVELTEESAKLALQQSVKVHIGDILKLDLFDEYFDVITMWHVFEHIRDPQTLLRKIYSWLKRDGLLVIAVPNIDSLQAKIFYKCWYHLDMPRHFFHYSPESLNHLLRKNHFTVFYKNHFILKNFFGFSQSFFNLMGYKRNFFKNILLDRNIKAKRISKIILIFLLPLVVTISVTICFIESLINKGGTFEVYCKKSTPKIANK